MSPSLLHWPSNYCSPRQPAIAEPRLKLMAAGQNGLISEIDWNTGRAVRNIGQYLYRRQFIGLTAAEDGTLFAIGRFIEDFQPNRLFKFDPSGRGFGGAKYLGGHAPGVEVNEGDLDFDPTSGKLYVIGQGGGLRTLDPNTALFTGTIPTPDLTNTGVPPIEYRYYTAMAFSADGTLYVLDSRQSHLYAVDKNNGSVLTSVPVVPGLSTFTSVGMDFHPQTGILYLTVPGGLYTLDPNTGTRAFIGAHSSIPQFNAYSGLTFVEVPEASSFVLLACFFGAVTLTVRRR